MRAKRYVLGGYTAWIALLILIYYRMSGQRIEAVKAEEPRIYQVERDAWGYWNFQVERNEVEASARRNRGTPVDRTERDCSRNCGIVNDRRTRGGRGGPRYRGEID